MSIDLLEPAAAALGDLRATVVFLGGATVGLWLTDAAARAPRITYDVDVVAVQVTTLTAYQTFQQQRRLLRFREDIESGVICRWRHDERGIVLDALPVREDLAGFAGRWLSAAVHDPTVVTLPSGLVIRAVRPAWLIATKLEAFHGRGGADCLGSRDFEDIVTLVDGRQDLAREIADLPLDVQQYIRHEFQGLVRLPSFVYGVEGALPDDAGGRADLVTIPRLMSIAGL
jgi:hypothetical protein